MGHVAARSRWQVRRGHRFDQGWDANELLDSDAMARMVSIDERIGVIPAE